MTDTATSELRTLVADLAAPLAASMGLALWGVEILGGGRSIVRVFLEGENGVTIDQCAELSRLLGLSLEVEDCVPGAYVLEVSSPGLERVFFTAEQLAGAVGKVIEVTLHQPLPLVPGRKKFRGELTGAADGVYTLRAEDIARAGEEAPLVELSFADVKKAKQVHFVPEKTLPGKKPGKK